MKIEEGKRIRSDAEVTLKNLTKTRRTETRTISVVSLMGEAKRVVSLCDTIIKINKAFE